MSLVKYLEARKRSSSDVGSIVGENNIETCSVLCDNYIDLIKDIETGMMVEACESCVYSSEELKIFKTGLSAVSAALIEAKHEQLQRNEKEAEEKRNKEKVEKGNHKF